MLKRTLWWLAYAIGLIVSTAIVFGTAETRRRR
jgi:hypothetical protein